MDVAVRRDFLMFTDIWALQAKSHDLALFIDGKGPDKHNVPREVGDRLVKVNQPILTRPKESAGSHGACNFAHYLASVIDVERFAVSCAGISAQRLHSGSAGPNESANASATLGSANDHSAVIDMV